MPHPTEAGYSLQAAVHWGPASPFFPPQVFFAELTSAVHQLRDRSLCLLPPVDRENGWEGIVDIGFWLGRAETWLFRYFDEGWAIPGDLWTLSSLRLPGYRYRTLEPEHRLIALPPQWAELEAGFGRVAVALSDGPGLGAVVAWEDSRGGQHEWKAGQKLAAGSETVLMGVWAHFTSPERAAYVSFASPSAQRRFDRLLMKDWVRCAQSGQERVTLISTPLDLGHGATSHWSFLRLTAPGKTDHPAPLVKLLAWHGAHLEVGVGIPLEQTILDKRRRAGRSDAMHDKISRTQVILVGLGSLGSEVAHLLAQEGIQSFYLVDGDLVLPGNEARHRAGLVHAGRAKVKVVEALIREIQPDAKVVAHQGWIDEVATQLENNGDSWDVLIIGATGDEATEHFLGDLARDLKVPCVHGWLELEGTVLRAMRYLPGLDPTISKVQGLDQTPRLEVAADADGPRICAETVLPGSALNIHASANFLVRVALDIITEEWSNENHWLFAPGGTKADTAPEALRRPYGTIAVELPD